MFAKLLNRLSHEFTKVKTSIFYGFLVKKMGVSCFVGKPLRWTPQYLEIADRVSILDDFRIEGIASYAGQTFTPVIKLEEGVSIQQRCHITAASELLIGQNTLISFDVSIQDTDHQYQQIDVPIGLQPLIVKQTKIGANCFIGSGAKIQAGTVLGKQCIVGTNAVVRGEFPDYSVIVGVPARIIKRYNRATKKWQKTDKNGEFISE